MGKNWRKGKGATKHGTLWGYQGRGCRCPDCHEVMLVYYSKRRAVNRLELNARAKARRQAYVAWIDSLKSAPCTDCTGSFDPRIMEYDHVRGEKKFAISDGNEHSRAAVIEELEKCELVCANCHRLRSITRGYGRSK